MASLDAARAAVLARDTLGLQVVGFDLAGEEAGYPASAHKEAFEYAHKHFLKRTVHAGEAYGPESIFQAITDLHADRIGHGTYLLEARRDPRPGDRGPRALRGEARQLHRRPAHHARGLPDEQPADESRR